METPATTLRWTTLETSMQLQSGHLFWLHVTLRIVLKRELVDCAPSREVPVLSIHRSRPFRRDLEIELSARGRQFPVEMLPVSAHDVRRRRFGLVYGPRRKRLRLCAPTVATYDRWEPLLALAVANAATERPTCRLKWLSPATSRSGFSAREASSAFSDEFGFSDNDNAADGDEGSDWRCHWLRETQRTPSTSSSSSSSSVVDS
ncbi:unnamed protein product [Hyaloperonospora brassicae]|uniref:RxLR effector candidate protein n=1 Tax=Hyaloperonospora brassicae TaxID=162125 RepID=A0AAV0UIH3_HYABA|nr:unnamed protein product [Hyaloperonospora brassicae]